ncbi:hypothetical protein J6590_063295 [Homalodisca vitripennis]|nr:hypothetical protein J6590_063295 [Homalodisca vitripennis]
MPLLKNKKKKSFKRKSTSLSEKDLLPVIAGCWNKSRARLDVVHRKEERGAEDITAERVMSSTESRVTAGCVSVLCTVAAIALTILKL